MNWCVGLVSLLSCALTPLLPRRAKRDRLHAALRTNESGDEEENQSIEPQDPKKKSVYEYRYHAVRSAAGSGITQSQGSMSKPILRSACDNVQERSARGSDRPCVLVLGKYINECGCVAFDVRSGESCVCVWLSCFRAIGRPVSCDLAPRRIRAAKASRVQKTHGCRRRKANTLVARKTNGRCESKVAGIGDCWC